MRNRRRATCGTFASVISSSSLFAKPEPIPPSAYSARKMSGYPVTFLATSRQPSRVVAAPDGAMDSPIFFISLANALRSSVSFMALMGVPSTLMLSRSKMPDSSSFMPQFSAV